MLFSMGFDQPNTDLLVNLETTLFSYFSSITKADEWHRLSLVNDSSDRIKFNLVYHMQQNADFLRTIHSAFLDGVPLQSVPTRLRHDTQDVVHPSSLLRFAQDIELVQQAEETMVEWMREIQKVHADPVYFEEDNGSCSSIAGVFPCGKSSPAPVR